MKPTKWLFTLCLASLAAPAAEIGREVSVPRHLQDGEEFELTTTQLLAHGRRLFSANWTIQEGAGRPLTKGTGAPLADLLDPLDFPRNHNRISGPDANSCAGCHNAPFGIPGGGGDIVTNVFVLGQRFDFATFDIRDRFPTRGTVDEAHRATTLGTIANNRATLGMFGSGYIEMLARQITGDLQSIRDGLRPGESAVLTSKGIDFGLLSRADDGHWDSSGVEGLPAPALQSAGPDDPPDLIVRPFHQAGAVVSLRQFTNNAYNHHHGIQTAERFGDGSDPDGDGFKDELTRADVTAVTLYQAAMAVPGRVIPNDPAIEAAVWNGEQLFEVIGCTGCHKPYLPLDDGGWIYSEPNPYNPPGNLQAGEARDYRIDLTDASFPSPRLGIHSDVVRVPAYTDFKLHDITDGPDDPNCEPLDMNQPADSTGFFAGNCRFITRKLWGVANEPPYFHHGKFTTLRQAVLAHAGEAAETRRAFEALDDYDRDSVIEFLKSLQVLEPGTRNRIVDENGKARRWPPQ